MTKKARGIEREVSSTEPWLGEDLLFLSLSLERGMSLRDIAGFLGRPEDEVREKARG